MIDYVLVFLIAVSISYLFTIPTIVIAKRTGFVTDTKKRSHPAHVHTGIIPRAGGIPVLVSFLITSLISVEINKIYTGIIIASILLVIVGLLDDYYDLSPYLRFFLNICISAIAIAFGLGIPFISNPFGGVIHLDQWKIGFSFLGAEHSILLLADILALFWLTWVTNMVNWSKGVDGQMPGFVAISALFLGILSQRFIAHDVSASIVMNLSLIVAGSFAGFLVFNMYPQKIMPGYSGGALAGFWLGVLSILSFGKIGTFMLVLAVPLIDACYTIVRRIAKGHSPFRPDREHLHHRLLALGWGKKRIAAFYWIITMILGCTSLLLNGTEKLIAFLAICLILISFFIIIGRISLQKKI